MSRSEFNTEERYIGTGALTDYSFDFKIESLAQLLIIELDDTGVETQRVRGTDTTYLSTVDFDVENGGGTVTLAAALDTDYTLIIQLANDEPTQPYEFRDKFSFTLKSFENALDWLAGAIQRLAWRSGRSVKLNDAYDNDTAPIDMELPVTVVAEAMLRMNDAGDGVDFGPTQTYIETAYDNAVQALADIAAHIADATDAHDASAISVVASGNLAATDVQTALDELQTDIDTRALQSDFAAHLADLTDAHDASAISVVASGNLTSTDVQGALDELQGDVDNHLDDTVDAHDASAISYVPTGGSITSTDLQSVIEEIEAEIAVIVSPGGLIASGIDFTPAGTIAATDVQAALEELDGDIQAHLSDAADAHDASAISSVAAGNLAATNVQTALDELQSDIDTRALDSDLTAHINDAADAHDASAISYAPAGAVVATDVQAAITELDSDLTAHINDAAGAHAASAIAVTPTGNLAADDVQEALTELQDDIDAINAAPVAGGGGGALRWIEDANAPLKTFESEIEVYEFQPGLAQELFLAIRVPSTYSAGQPITLNILWYCASTANDALINAVATLIRSEVDAYSSTTNQRTTTNAAITMAAGSANEPQKVTLDISSNIGQINGVAVSPGDLIKVKVKESSSTVADNIKLVFDASEVKFT